MFGFGKDAAPPAPKRRWQNVAGSRATGTPYVNDTGEEIVVAVRADSGGAGTVLFYATVTDSFGSVTVPMFGGAVSGGSYPFGGNVTVPAGATYTIVNGGVGSFVWWAELRK